MDPLSSEPGLVQFDADDGEQMWTETPKWKGKKPVNKDRFISYVGYHAAAKLIP